MGYRAGYKSQEFITNTLDTIEKPVVYFYPTENDTKISYTTRASRDFTVSYPSYNNGWHFTANMDGTLAVDNRQYNYLYWEAQNAKFISNISTKDGWIIPSSEVTSFLEDKPTYMGLNEKEQSDFISYWLPTLTSKPYIYIKFANDEFEEYVQ